MTQAADLAGDVRQMMQNRGRLILGIAGAPASGKSTIAAQLAAQIDNAIVLPMDGFHLDDRILAARNRLHRKGAPDTFDVAGFVALLQRLKSGETLFAPQFDRTLELSRNSAIEIPASTRLIIVEGNYLLHDAQGWQNVQPLLDACWFLQVPEPTLQARLTARWQDLGLPDKDVIRKVQDNDLPNAKLVIQGQNRADRIIGFDDLQQPGPR